MHEKTIGFIRYLASLAGGGKPNTGAMAALRRSVAFEPGAYAQSFPYVEPWTRGLEGWPRKAYYLVAGLYAHHQKHSDGLPFAKAYFRVAEKRRRNRNSKDQGQDSLERRFLALLDSDEEEIVYRLRQAVSLLQDTGFDWAGLLNDLLFWHAPERRNQVKVAWARQFYGGEPTEKTKEEAE